jgi:hypothetical protein
LRAADSEKMNDASSQTTRVSILTFEPGQDLFAAFGHIALVTRRSGASARVYNFGNYDFGRPAAVWRYAKGELDYWISVSTLDSTLKRYRHFNRGAVLRTLDLNDQQTKALVESLEQATLPENRRYRYNHITHNCCTRVRDIVDNATGGALLRQFSTRPASRTYREWLWTLLGDRPAWLAFLDISLGPSVDGSVTRYEEQFLPLVLSADLDEAVLSDGRPLVALKEQLLPQGARVQGRPHWWWGLLGATSGLGALCLALAWGARPWSRRVLGGLISLFGLTSGLAGAWLVFLALGSHVDAHGNANLLVFPMTHLWLIGPGIGLLGSGRLGANLSHWTWRYLAVSVAAAWGALVLGLLGYQELARWALPMAIFVSALTAAIFRVTRTATPIPSWRPTVDESTQILGNTPSLPWIDSCKESK